MTKSRHTIKNLSLVVAAIIYSVGLSTHHTYAADSAVTCSSLVAEQSEDKSYYRFTASATAPGNIKITGYEFNFGDHQTYIVNFNDMSSKDTSVAVAKHTYDKAGNYIAKANVVSSKDNKAIRTSSPGCTTNIVIGQPAITMLPTTGPSGSLILLLSITLGTFTYITVRLYMERL